MRRDAVRVASPSWNMVLRRADQDQFYMELTPLLFYLGAMVLRQTKCNSVCSTEAVTLVTRFINKLSTMVLFTRQSFLICWYFKKKSFSPQLRTILFFAYLVANLHNYNK